MQSEKKKNKLFVFLLFALLLSKLVTEIFLYVKQGTESEVFDGFNCLRSTKQVGVFQK